MNTRSYKLFGKNVLATFCHHIMSLSFDNATSFQSNLDLVRVTEKSEEMIDGPYSIRTAKKIVSANKGYCDVFVASDVNGHKIGTISVMYRGGNDIEYRIRNIDAFIYNVFVDTEFRGNGYAGDMIRILMQHLYGKGINKAYLAVSTNNHKAVRAYEKVGFVTEKDLRFVRVLKINIPYWVL